MPARRPCRMVPRSTAIALLIAAACAPGAEREAKPPPAAHPPPAAAECVTQAPEPRAPAPAPFARSAVDDFAIGAYPSAHDLLLRSIEASAGGLDASARYDECADQGILLQAIVELLALAPELPGGDAERERLVEIAFGELDELVAASRMTHASGPAFGLLRPYDAFQDGSTNPPGTAYSWQSGAIVLGAAELLSYFRATGSRHEVHRARIAALERFTLDMLAFWEDYATFFEQDGKEVGYYWYSSAPADAKAVHNTSVMIAMARQLVADSGIALPNPARPRAVADFLRMRSRVVPPDALIWNYVDDGYPEAMRRAEDLEHVKTDLQFVAFAARKGWWTADDLRGVANAFFGIWWIGNPSRLAGRTDGSSDGAIDYEHTTSALMGLPSLADAPGVPAELFDHARSVLFSAYLMRFDIPLAGATDAARAASLARMLTHRPAAFDRGSRWSVRAGESADCVDFAPDGWSATATVTAGLPLPARRSMAGGAPIVLTLPEGDRSRVAVALTYRATERARVLDAAGAVIAELVPTVHEDGVNRWMRTSFVVPSGPRADADAARPGIQLALRIDASVDVHQIEATPL